MFNLWGSGESCARLSGDKVALFTSSDQQNSKNARWWIQILVFYSSQSVKLLKTNTNFRKRACVGVFGWPRYLCPFRLLAAWQVSAAQRHGARPGRWLAIAWPRHLTRRLQGQQGRPLRQAEGVERAHLSGLPASAATAA